jgi:aspartate aminotransferase
MVNKEFDIPATAENIIVGPGAKVFETYFCEAFLEPGDEVLLFSPTFPTYEPNIFRRAGKPVYANLTFANSFRPNPDDIANFLKTSKQPKAIFLNSPHNPTGGVATKSDLDAIAQLIAGKNIAVFSDEPYCHMLWPDENGSPRKHHSILAVPGMMKQCVAAFTLSKSYSMSGWRCGFAVAKPDVALAFGKMINTSLSCVPPLVQWAGKAAIENDTAERDQTMAKFHNKVRLLVDQLKTVTDVKVEMPAGTFYVFPNIEKICEKLKITSHGLAMYLLEAADDSKGVACLGGECFGEAGRGFLRMSCAEPDDRLIQAVQFLKEAVTRTDRVKRYLESNPQFRL